jgi:hypothetical protein
MKCGACKQNDGNILLQSAVENRGNICYCLIRRKQQSISIVKEFDNQGIAPNCRMEQDNIGFSLTRNHWRGIENREEISTEDS